MLRIKRDRGDAFTKGVSCNSPAPRFWIDAGSIGKQTFDVYKGDILILYVPIQALRH
jgi:hypothetical protein